MARKIILSASIVLALSIFGCAGERYAQNNKSHHMQKDTVKMTMQDVVSLTKAGVSDSLIIGMMDATDTWFRLKPQDVIDLRNAGVSENVIHAMMQKPTETAQSDSSKEVRYYVYPDYWWYGGYNPYWYYPRFSVRLGFGHGFGHFHYRHFR